MSPRRGRDPEPEEYDEIEGKLRFPKGTTPDMSRKTSGALRATTRDAHRHLVGQAEFIPNELVRHAGSTTPDEADEVELWSVSSEDICETDEDPPDALDSVPWPVTVGLLGLGVVGAVIQARREEKSQESQEQTPGSGPVDAGLPPEGWYSVASDLSELRYWDGSCWTNQFARVRDTANVTPADWYPDPTAPATGLRYWDGSTWTDHVQPTNVPADWYPDPSDPSSVRWWDGTAWTDHIAPMPSRASGHQVAVSVGPAPIYLSRGEWAAHLQAWAAAGALEQSLWWRLTHAHITDADPMILEAQQRMQTLTPAESAVRLRAVLRQNPALTQQAAVHELVTFLTQGRGLDRSEQRMLNRWP